MLRGRLPGTVVLFIIRFVPKLLSIDTFRALRAAGADEEAAERAAADVGGLWHEVEGLRGRVNLLIGLVILVLGVLFQVAFRLD